jgi:hypothetical protein
MHPATRSSTGGVDVVLEGRASQRTMLTREHPGPRAVLNAIVRVAEGHDIDLGIAWTNLRIARDRLASYTAWDESEFPGAAHSAALEEMRGQLQAGLSGHKEIDLADVSARAEAAMAGSGGGVEAGRERAEAATSAEEPVTTRILRGLAGAVRPVADDEDGEDEAVESTEDEAAEDDQDEIIPMDEWPAVLADDADWDEPFRLRA